MALPATDTFTRADAGTLGANWTDNPSLSGLSIVSNEAKATAGGGFNNSYWTADTFSNDQYSLATFPVIADAAVTVRNNGDNFYMWYHAGGSSNRFFYKRVSGSFTSLGDRGTGGANGDTLKLTVSGTTLTGYVNGSALGSPTTDASLTSGSAGLVGYQPSGTRIDNWEGGDLGGGGGGLAIPVAMAQYRQRWR